MIHCIEVRNCFTRPLTGGDASSHMNHVDRSEAQGTAGRGSAGLSVARQGRAGQGVARPGKVWPGMARGLWPNNKIV